MHILTTIPEINKFLQEKLLLNQSVGFVPTMGALHDGHISLIKQALSENQLVICSIFVNPTQFNNPEDLKLYPRTPESDFKKLEEAGCNAIFYPTIEEMYPEFEVLNHFNLGELETLMEGSFRPNHFRGVVTIVKKLFDIVKPTNAYFGLKDFQQVAVIKKMVADLKLPVTIVACPTLQEKDGLAMSSRNIRLDEKERCESVKIYEALNWIKQNKANYLPEELQKEALKKITTPLLNPEYLEIVNPVTLQPIKRWNEVDKPVVCVATWCGKVRLIDNMEL
ncbi:MAG: pantoate--beta-alanine ligase [Bacteroidia bacterium]|nr:pantoate--beta-alanine ligase [Bacteroidia bacterium]